MAKRGAGSPIDVSRGAVEKTLFESGPFAKTTRSLLSGNVVSRKRDAHYWLGSARLGSAGGSREHWSVFGQHWEFPKVGVSR